MKKTLAVIMFTIVIIVFTECQKKSRSFYIDILNVYLHIEEIKSGLYRLHISEMEGKDGEDYIDFVYKFSEMPSITISFPLDDSNDIYVIDRQHGEVRFCKSNDYNIIYPIIDNNNYIELSKYQKWCDSVMFDIHSISIQIDPYLKSLSLWNEDSKYLGQIYPK